MTRYYLDTSAAAKLIANETESAELARWADSPDVELVATHLLETEVRRFVQRHALPQTAATAILDRVSLYDLPPSLFHEAGIIVGPTLSSLDALHLIGAIRLDVAALVCYDERLMAAATGAGLGVVAPGRL